MRLGTKPPRPAAGKHMLFGQACLRAEGMIGKCFNGGNKPHRAELAAVLRVMRACEQKLVACGCV